MAALRLNALEPKIIVHDYNPDKALITAKTDTLTIDINNDTINDILIYLTESSPGNWAIINTLNSNCQFSLICYYTKSDSLKSDSIVWKSCNSHVCWFNGKCNNVEKIGVKITKDGLNYSGWIHSLFSIENREALITIDKYAFCTIPDYPLLWGQTELTGTKEIKVQDKINVTVDNQSQNINIQSKEVVKEISLINSLGRIIRKWRNIKSSKVDFPSEGIRGGVYFLRIKNEDNEVVTEKIVL